MWLESQMKRKWQCYMAWALADPTAISESVWLGACSCSSSKSSLQNVGQLPDGDLATLLTQLSPFISLYCTLLV